MSAPSLTRKPCPGCGYDSPREPVAGYCPPCTALRDTAANSALVGLLAAETPETERSAEKVAEMAYFLAEAMLVARKVRQ